MTVSHKLRLDTEAQFAARKGKDAIQYEFKDYKGSIRCSPRKRGLTPSQDARMGSPRDLIYPTPR
jgi:hypothetical protein